MLKSKVKDYKDLRPLVYYTFNFTDATRCHKMRILTR